MGFITFILIKLVFRKIHKHFLVSPLAIPINKIVYFDYFMFIFLILL